MQVRSKDGEWLATFTIGARSVVVKGPRRVFSEPSTPQTVSHDRWVRLLPKPFTGEINNDWLQKTLKNRSPDALGLAFQYVKGAPSIKAGKLRIAGDASYGPEGGSKRAEEGSDYNDFLGITVRYEDRKDRPEKRQKGSLDCSGYVRMVYGYRLGIPLTLTPKREAIPRRAFQIFEEGPGVQIDPELKDLQPGDLVFFDADAADGAKIDHVGIYLGVDSAGHHRFLSSRKGADGPTMGDLKGASILDGHGHYAKAFKGARRI